MQNLRKKLNFNSESFLYENKFLNVVADTAGTICNYENVNVTIIRCVFTNISTSKWSPCFYSNKCSIMRISGNHFSTCVGTGGGDFVYSNTFALNSSPNITLTENSITQCSPAALEGCDSSMFIGTSKAYWRNHNASYNGGTLGGAIGTLTSSDSSDIKYLMLSNPLDETCFVSHSSNNISNLIVINAYTAYRSVIWIRNTLNLFNSLLLNCKDRLFYGNSRNINFYDSYVQKDDGDIGKMFETNFDVTQEYNKGLTDLVCTYVPTCIVNPQSYRFIDPIYYLVFIYL